MSPEPIPGARSGSSNGESFVECFDQQIGVRFVEDERRTDLQYVAVNNKIYCANKGSDNIAVIGGAVDSVIATVAAGSGPRALCYNPRDNTV